MEGDRRQVLILGLCLELVLAGLVVGLVALRGYSLWPSMTVLVDFDEVSHLKEGAPVRFSGLTIGRVLTIRHAALPGEPPLRSHLRLELRIEQRHSHHFLRNSDVTVAAQGLFGNRYVQVSPPSEEPGPMVTPGALLVGRDAPKMDRMIQHTHQNLRATLALARELEPEVLTLVESAARVRHTLDETLPRSRVQALHDRLQRVENEARAMVETLAPASAQATSPWTLGRGLVRDLSGRFDQMQGLWQRGKAIEAAARPLASLGEPGDRARLDRALDQLLLVQQDLHALSGLAAALGQRLRSGEGTAARLLGDSDIVDEVKQTRRLLMEAPWRVLARPPAAKAPRGRPPRRETSP